MTFSAIRYRTGALQTKTTQSILILILKLLRECRAESAKDSFKVLRKTMWTTRYFLPQSKDTQVRWPGNWELTRRHPTSHTLHAGIGFSLPVWTGYTGVEHGGMELAVFLHNSGDIVMFGQVLQVNDSIRGLEEDEGLRLDDICQVDSGFLFKNHKYIYGYGGL